MKKFKLKQVAVVVGAMIALSTFTGALKIEELSLNNGYTDNLRIVQPELVGETSKHYLTNDVKEIYLNLRDLETKHIYDRLPQKYKYNLNAYLHRTSLENALAGSPLSRGEEVEKVSMLEIIEENNPSTENIRTNEDYLKLLRAMYQDTFDRFFTVSLIEKKGNKVDATFTNYSQYKVRSIKGNLRILENENGKVVYDGTFTQSFVAPVPSDRMIKFSETVKIDNPRFTNIPGDKLIYQAKVQEVVLSNGQYLNLQEIFDKQTEKQVVKPTRKHP